MPEYGLAIEVMHTDKDWKIDPANPLVWAPPCPQDKVEIAKHSLVFNFQRTRKNHPELASITKIEFIPGPCRHYVETIYRMDSEYNIAHDEEGEPIIEDTIVHTDTWIYLFGWYVNTDARTAPGRSGFHKGGIKAYTTPDDKRREVIEVPLEA